MSHSFWEMGVTMIISRLAMDAYLYHKSAFECWEYGNISEIWSEECCDLCIRYESGKWWHYKKINDDWIWW